MYNIDEMIEIVENMQLGEIKDELELLKDREGPENNITRELLKYELFKREQRKAPDYQHYIIMKNKHGKFEICDKDYAWPVETHKKYERAAQRKHELNAEYRQKQRT